MCKLLRQSYAIILRILSLGILFLCLLYGAVSVHADETENVEDTIPTVETPVGWLETSNGWMYYDANGNVSYGWIQDSGNWYFMNSAGIMQTGWLKDHGNWYYLTPGTGGMQAGWSKVDGSWYYLTPGTGGMQTGWSKVDGFWYYLTPGTGGMQTGWRKIDGIWYYLNANGMMATGWKRVDGTWYYLSENGAMAIGWKKVDDIWYYLNENGSMATGWIKVNGDWYYLVPGSGEMLTGFTTVNGYVYYFDESGRWGSEYSYLNAAGGSGITTFGDYSLSWERRNDIQNALNGMSGYYCGFMLVDLNTGKGIQYNADQVLFSASSIKGPYIASMIANYPSSASTNSGLIHNVLWYSNDYDYATLVNTYGRGHFNDWCSAAELSTFYWTAEYGFYSPRDLAKLWIRMNRFFVDHPDIAAWYEEPSESAIHRVLGGKYKTRSKAGYNILFTPRHYPEYDASCDGGLVYASNGTYLVAIMTNYPNDQNFLNDLVRALDAAHDEM